MTLRPEFEACVLTEREINADYQATVQRKQILEAKQGRASQFKTKKDRDDFLKKEYKAIGRVAAEQQKQLQTVQDELKQGDGRRTALETETERIRARLDQHRQELDTINQTWKTTKENRDRLYEARKELWRQDAQTDAAVAHGKEEVRKAYRSLTGSVDHNTSVGLEAVRRISERMGLKGVYGPLYELFDVEEVYSTAVEVIAGARWVFFC